jgi:beta-lactamase superfamily II metal-dependent hydrolase
MLALAAASLTAQPRDAKSLQIYVLDVEGGNATLFVAPSGESVLVDTGNGGAAAARDTDRMMAAITDAGVKRIDHLITTHWHGDHFGAMAELASRIEIRHYVDHGPTVEPQPRSTEFLATVYPPLYAKAKHTIVQAGDRLPVSGLDWYIVTSGGNVITTPLAGAGAANPSCAAFKPVEDDKTENAQSVGSVVTFGNFRLVHLGDLTWNKEFALMCPANRIGTMDLFIVSHHGQATSNSEVLVHAIRPRVAVMNNGVKKGAQPSAMKILLSAPRLEDLWELHRSLVSGPEYVVPETLIANLEEDHQGPARWIKVTAQTDGSFSVINTRNGFTKTYAKPQ